LSVSAQVPVQGSPFWESIEQNVYSTGMIWEDVNRDGYLDVFISNGNDIVRAANYIYISDRGTLPTSSSWGSSNIEYSGHCAVGDINDNGYPDFVVANFLGLGGFAEPNTSTLHLNPFGWPNRIPDWRQSDSAYSFSCALGDADGDGDLDLAITTGDGYNNVHTTDRVYFNVDGELESTPGWESSLLTAAMDVTWGDVNNDGFLDLAYTTDNYGSVVYYNQGGTLETTPSWQSSDSDPGNTLIFGDVNGDGWLDLIVACNNQLGDGGYFRVYFNNGSGTLATSPGWQSATGGYGSSVCLYDYDNDGDDDLSAGRWWDRPRIYENTGVTFTTSPIWQAVPSTVVEEIAWVDVDGDGAELYADTMASSGGKKLFYTTRHPLHSVDSVIVDGTKLDDAGYCYDLVYGWISLAAAPAGEMVVHYKHSFKCDLTVSNWDTHNEAFANTLDPFVEFHADTTVGWAPFTVQFADSSTGASAWEWNFGDGDGTVGTPDPSHVYNTGGVFDVTLSVALADGNHKHQIPGMVVALADTLIINNTLVSSGSLTITIDLKNSLPMHRLELPISYAGDIDLVCVGFDTDSCRTDYFNNVRMNSFDPNNKRLCLLFEPDGAPPLPPGKGRLINLHFNASGTGSTTIDTITFSSRVLELDAGFMTYQPFVVNDQGQTGLCGDIDGNGTVFDITDLIHLVMWMFQGGPAPVSMELANMDGQQGIDITDLILMVMYMFQGGPLPTC
jgi:PKD repeat protein